MFVHQRLAKRLLFVFVAVFAAISSYSTSVVAEGVSASQNPILPVLTVYKNPNCGCCGKWVSHLQENGFQATTVNRHDLSALKAEKGINQHYQSCHTAISKGGYVFEGHVPAKFIQQFLQEKPQGAIGLAVPAMLVGTPGMEVGNKFMPYEVLLLKADGSDETYAPVNTQQEQY